MKKLRWLKSYQGSKIGEEFNAGAKSAENFVSQGYAEYIHEPIKETTPEEAKYHSDKMTLETGNNLSFIQGSKDKETACKMLRVDPKSYDRYKKELEFNRLEKKDSEVLQLLDSEDNQDLSYLDLGECAEGWYNGFNLDGKEAIITTEGNIFRNKEINIKGVTIGENEIKKLINYSGYIGEIAPVIAKDTIKSYYIQSSRNNRVDPKQIYRAVRDKILFYMDFSGADEIADVLACWIMATYLYPLFYWFPHVLFNAPSQSGKTKAAQVVIFMAFRGFDLGASAGVTPPQIFRTIEGNRGTMLIDEFEQAQRGKGIAETQQLVNQLLNASASKDAYVIRVEQVNGNWKAKKFPIFCPKVSCNISGINPTSLSRYIAFSWLKTISEKSRRKPTREGAKREFRAIQQDLYLFALEYWKEIKDIYESLELPNVANRDEDNWMPLYSIAKFIDSCDGETVNAEQQLNKYLETYKDVQIETNDNTEDFFKILFEKVEDKPQYYTPKSIGECAAIQDLLSYLKSPAHWIGKTLKAYKFQSSRGGGVKKYLLSKDSVQKIIEVYFNKNIIPPNSTIDTQQHKQHVIPQINTDNKIHKENVSLGGVCGIIPVGGIDISQSEVKGVLKELEEKQGKHIPLDLILNKFPKEDTDKVKQVLEDLRKDGSIFEPKEGVMQLI